ncbi:hypothetical protein OG372_28500 [Streptomyces sp. NBC_01020]|uniref:hypothetical protein n=1 Tax=unclassified Streptomyces TaxID=2593676 RepID=UPI002E2117E3|nr:hypothetical protein OG372_28500 [Streptomyces sp. NBC_01020]WSX66672.1 hypothetical protein OG221_08630 [Streptomyces sp. NBC_00932]
MRGLAHWEELRSGDSGELILAVDTPPRGPAPSDFRELIPLLDTRHTVWRATESDRTHPRGTCLDEYIAPWTDEVRAAGLRVRAVLGYGVGGIFAGAIADGVGRDQGRTPEVLLFDPELVDSGTVVDEFRRLVSTVSHSLTGRALERLERESAALLADAGADDDAGALAIGLHGVLSQAIGDEPERVGSVAGMAGQALGLATARLSSLAIADAVNVVPLWSAGTALCSSSPDSGLNRTRSVLLLPDAALVGREILFEDRHAEVLRSTTVARMASELLGSSDA